MAVWRAHMFRTRAAGGLRLFIARARNSCLSQSDARVFGNLRFDVALCQPDKDINREAACRIGRRLCLTPNLRVARCVNEVVAGPD